MIIIRITSREYQDCLDWIKENHILAQEHSWPFEINFEEEKDVVVAMLKFDCWKVTCI